jgi:drug/metabolite transporter (DMT)-like permease
MMTQESCEIGTFGYEDLSPTLADARLAELCFHGFQPMRSGVYSFAWRVPCMTSSSGLHFKTYCMILIMVVFGPLGNVLLGKGMKNVGSAAIWAPSELPHIFIRIFTSGYIWLGVASLLTFFVAYMLILSWADFSYVQPASSVAYLVVALLGYFYLGEKIAPLHWAGIGVICLGVFVVGNTPPRTTEAR